MHQTCSNIVPPAGDHIYFLGGKPVTCSAGGGVLLTTGTSASMQATLSRPGGGKQLSTSTPKKHGDDREEGRSGTAAVGLKFGMSAILSDSMSSSVKTSPPAGSVPLLPNPASTSQQRPLQTPPSNPALTAPPVTSTINQLHPVTMTTSSSCQKNLSPTSPLFLGGGGSNKGPPSTSLNHLSRGMFPMGLPAHVPSHLVGGGHGSGIHEAAHLLPFHQGHHAASGSHLAAGTYEDVIRAHLLAQGNLLDTSYLSVADWWNQLSMVGGGTPLPPYPYSYTGLGGHHNPFSQLPQSPLGPHGMFPCGGGGVGGVYPFRSKPRRAMLRRAVFSDSQRKGLETAFTKHAYITKPDRKELAETLGLKDAQVKIWFQNRRMKWRNAKEREQLVPGNNNNNRHLSGTSNTSCSPLLEPLDMGGSGVGGGQDPCSIDDCGEEIMMLTPQEGEESDPLMDSPFESDEEAVNLIGGGGIHHGSDLERRQFLHSLGHLSTALSHDASVALHGHSVVDPARRNTEEINVT